jgi:hypothetical protein
MNKFIITAIISISVFSCAEDPAADVTTNTDTVSTAGNNDASTLAYPVKYVNWEIGDFNNVRLVTDMYKVWDEQQAKGVAVYFADTVRMRLPEVRNEIVVLNSEVNARMATNRNMYGYTDNDMISAVSLRDKASGEEWVMITTYAKWTEKSGKRDSILYHDDWRVKDGKINFLMSYSKLPTAEFLKNQTGK